MKFHTILTHESPDLDAIVCCYLLLHYGESRYPGIARARIRFCPAGQLPDGKNAGELEREGTIVVDVGGGRFDTHPDGHLVETEKLDLSAANLVASDLGVDDRPGLQNLLEFVRTQDCMGKSLSSRNPIDHAVALPNLLRGGVSYFGEDYAGMVDFFMRVLEAIETAGNSPKAASERNDSFYLIAEDGGTLFAPPVLNLTSLFVAYIGARFLHKDIQWQWAGTKDLKRSDLSEILGTWGLSERPELKKLSTFFSNLKPDAYLLESDDYLDRTVSLPNIVEGFYSLHEKDLVKVAESTFVLFDCILSYERSWDAAVAEYQEKRQLYRIGKYTLVAIESEHGAVGKVARWRDKADIIVYRDTKSSNISISLNKLGRLKHFALYRLAAKMRTCELVLGNRETQYRPEELSQIGEIENWFLHQSQQLLLHGSPKARRMPSRVPFETIVGIVKSELDTDLKLPDNLCPIDHCIHQQCAFYSLRLPNCFAHRQQLRGFISEDI